MASVRAAVSGSSDRQRQMLCPADDGIEDGYVRVAVTDSGGYRKAFDPLAWRSATIRLCLPSFTRLMGNPERPKRSASPNDPPDYLRRWSVETHTAVWFLRLLRRLWDTPGERVQGLIPEAVLWRWLRKEAIFWTGELRVLPGPAHERGFVIAPPSRSGEVMPNDPVSIASYPERIQIAARLCDLIPERPLTFQERQTMPADELLELERDMNQVADAIDALVVGLAYPGSEDVELSRPDLTAAERLIDDLLRWRATGPIVEVSPAKTRKKSPGRPRKGGGLKADYRELTILFEEYADDGLSEPARGDMATRLGVSESTIGERIRAFKSAGLQWPPIVDDEAA